MNFADDHWALSEFLAIHHHGNIEAMNVLAYRLTIYAARRFLFSLMELKSIHHTI
jgi:hypothetical protein